MVVPTDMMLILEHDLDALIALRSVAERFECDRVEAISVQSVFDILGLRHPTMRLGGPGGAPLQRRLNGRLGDA